MVKRCKKIAWWIYTFWDMLFSGYGLAGIFVVIGNDPTGSISMFIFAL